jgi:hypothetical protein
MTISYSNFLTQVRNYTEVESNVLSDTLLDQFIRNTELDIAGKVDYDDLRKYATSTLVSGQRYVNTPAELLIIRSVQLISGSTRTFLEKRDTSFISEYNTNDSLGFPKYYANWDDQNVIFAPTPDATYTVQINYIQDPPHFTSTNQTFLSQFQEAMLLNGVLTECFRYLKGPYDLYNLYLQRYNEDVQAFSIQQMGRRRRAEYDDGVPRIQVPSPSP